MAQLNGSENHGRRLWTPPKLKSMNSWQQQDAQEYFSKVLDDVDREIIKARREQIPRPGLENLASPIDGANEQTGQHQDDTEAINPFSYLRNPLEGLLAQRVGCTECKYTEGFSMIPFNCLTLPLGRDWAYSVRGCLDEYTALEYIDGVECGKCTLLHAKSQLERLSSSSAPTNEMLQKAVKAKLETILEALENDDFSDNSLIKKCNIPKKQWISSKKSRQAVIGRPPQSLVLHVNRSIFDEYSGAQFKNHARLEFQKTLDLSPWCLGGAPEKDEKPEHWPVDPTTSILPAKPKAPESSFRYELRAVVTHYGRHENGHYICYRKHPPVVDDSPTDGPNSNAVEEKDEQSKNQSDGLEHWWRFSDDDVSAVSEEQVLRQPEVFMLFYERVPVNQSHESLLHSEVKVHEGISEVQKAESLGNVDNTNEVLLEHPEPETRVTNEPPDAEKEATLLFETPSLQSMQNPDVEEACHDKPKSTKDILSPVGSDSLSPSTAPSSAITSASCDPVMQADSLLEIDSKSEAIGLSSSSKHEPSSISPSISQPLKMRTAGISHQGEQNRDGLRMVAAT